jgi:glycosyltransferase involved in cell wall biosynthesis
MTLSTSVAICITTYRRPDMLRRLLQAIQALVFVKVIEPQITIVVVDNDTAASGRAVVAEFLSKRYRLRYRIESRPGVSHTRNTAIEAARTADFVAFLDDDEEPSPAWLEELLSVESAFGAPIVAGPIVPRFQFPPPQWILDGRFFQRKRYATGTRIVSTSVGNVLICSRLLHAMSPAWFDPRYSLSGGEDTHFFRRCAQLGCPITWADDAVAYETIPDSRLSPSYLVARARNGGNHWTRVDLDLCPTLPRLGSRFAAGIVRVLQGTAVAAVAPVLPPQKQLRGQLLLAEGIGNLTAFFGHRYAAYGPEHQ